MLYEYALTVPLATPASAPTTLEVALSAGTVTQVSVQFPAGCRGLVRVAIYRSNHQVWPGNLDGYLAAENHVIIWPDDYDLTDRPFSVQLRGWAPATQYPHTITFRFAVLELERKREAAGIASGLRRMAEVLLGRKG